jgi:hypothetical protein
MNSNFSPPQNQASTATTADRAGTHRHIQEDDGTFKNVEGDTLSFLEGGHNTIHHEIQGESKKKQLKRYSLAFSLTTFGVSLSTLALDTSRIQC